ncbi:hypothetical protein [Streptomyces gardneri]|uniref:hypothetical protein n=1 Tax=Streptomyces gardneri TaxID=66892 RepID=UPI0036A448E0
MGVDRCRGRLWTVVVLVVQTDALFWDTLVFDGIDEVDVEARPRSARSRWWREAALSGQRVLTAAASRTGSTTDTSAG